MGTVQHHAIIATTENDKERNRILRWIADLPPMYYRLFTSTESIINCFTTIVMTPDGSYDGRIDSDEGDGYRESFIYELKKADTEEEGTIYSPWHWIEVTYGEVGYGVTATNCVNDDTYMPPTPAQATDTALRFVADSLSHAARDNVLAFAKFLKATDKE